MINHYKFWFQNPLYEQYKLTNLYRYNPIENRLEYWTDGPYALFWTISTRSLSSFLFYEGWGRSRENITKEELILIWEDSWAEEYKE